MPAALTLGLDLARVRDFTALAALEPWRGREVLVHLSTWRPRREDCADAVLDVLAFLERNPGPARLAIDGRNEVGAAVVSAAIAGEIGRRAEIYPLLPSHSQRPAKQREDRWIFVGKRALVEGLARALDAGKLLVAPGLPEATALRREMQRLDRVPTRRGSDWTYSHPTQRVGDHDDRVMAVAYAYWLASTLSERGQAVIPANTKTDTRGAA